MADRKSETEKNDLIGQFSAVTGLGDLGRARFFLEAAGWSLDMAVASFYDEPGSDQDVEPDLEPVPPPPREPTPPRGDAGGRGGPAKPRAAPQSNSRFASLSTMRRDESSASEEEEGEAYYAGGSERGAGQQIIGQPKKKGDSNRIVENMFKAAKERGAEVVDPSEEGASRGRPGGGGGLFQGVAYRLGDSAGAPSMQVGGSSSSASASASGSGRRQVDVTLHLWRNGFSVDDGALRDYQSEDNQQFLNSIRNGEIPRELIREAQGAQVNLNMHDHRTEDFVQRKAAIKTFCGEGHRLGSPTNGAALPATAAVAPEVAASQLSEAASAVKVDPSAPTTSLQIRLNDGSRIVSKFNTTHTIADVRRYIVIARPEYAAVSWSLMTTFPNKTLTDESQTLAQAGLLNAVLVLSPNK